MTDDTSNPPGDNPPSDRRNDSRRTVLKPAQVVYNEGKSTIPCRIRNMSETGARLEFPTVQLLPHTFELHVPGMPVRQCMLRWAKDNLAGVWFAS